MACGILLGESRRVFVTKDAEQETNKVPDTDENAVVSPVAAFRNHLRIQHRRAERQDGKDHQANVLATVFNRNDLASASESDELV